MPGFTWHTDTSYRKHPSRCSLLYAKEVPHRDGKPLGDTVFANYDRRLRGAAARR